MTRCPACGAFVEGDKCPNTMHHPKRARLLRPPPRHARPTPPMLPQLPSPVATTPPPLVGAVAWYDWPGSGRIPCLITSEPDEDGMVGLMILASNIRVNIEDTHTTGEPDGEPTP